MSFQPSGFFMLTRGMMSVLSSLFFFCLGSGASTCRISDEIKTLGRTSTQTFLVLLNIEAAEQHDGLGSVDATEDLVGRFDVGTLYLISLWFQDQSIRCKNLLVTDAHDTATATEAIVEAAKVDGADAELAQDGGTHDAWLYGDVQVSLLEDRRWVLVQDLAEGHEFGMACSLGKRICQMMHALYEKTVVSDKVLLIKCRRFTGVESVMAGADVCLRSW